MLLVASRQSPINVTKMNTKQKLKTSSNFIIISISISISSIISSCCYLFVGLLVGCWCFCFLYGCFGFLRPGGGGGGRGGRRDQNTEYK